MAESFIAFATSVASLAWTIIPGVLSWWLLDFPELFMSARGKEGFHAWTRARKPYVVSALIVLGIFVSMFLAFHDERIERLKKEKEIEAIKKEVNRIKVSCSPNFNWEGDVKLVEEHPIFKRTTLVRLGRVNPLSRESFFMTIEAYGEGLDALYIIHQTVEKDPLPRMRSLIPSGIEARALNPFSLIEVVAVIHLPQHVTFNEPSFYCEK